MAYPFERPKGPNSSRYQKSRRATLRSGFLTFRSAGGHERVPRIFGPHTAIFALLARYGPMRRQYLQGVLRSGAIDNFQENDKAGISVQWHIPGAANGAMGIALNPGSPLLNQMRRLLNRLCDVYDINFNFGLEVYRNVKERVVIRKVKRAFNADLLFGSKSRTYLLATLELLGGETGSYALFMSMPGDSIGVKRDTIARLVRDGIIQRKAGTVSFVDSPWSDALRRLLRAYLRENADCRSLIKQRIGFFRKTLEERTSYGLFAKSATERMLTALAVNGPMRIGRLSEAIMARVDGMNMSKFQSDGIVVISKKPGATTVSLNAAHPAYAELRALLLAILGKRRAAGCASDLRSEPLSSDVTYLFTTSLRLDVLAMLAVCEGGETDSSSLSLLCPSHDRGVIRERLKSFEAMGIVMKRWSAGVCLYRLDSNYLHSAELRRLLNRIADLRPHYRSIAQVEEELFKPHRAARQRKIVASRPSEALRRKPRL
jgi:hypothetical protein